MLLENAVVPVQKAPKPKLMRDAFIDVIYEAAQRDRDILFLSADFGAAALDAFREKLPAQFIHAGIAEQNMVDVGAGLALSGKKVFLYAMAPFLTARCYEQIKAVVASMNLPITFVAVGVGLGYDHATLTHFTPEDIASMKALNRIEVLSPCDAESAAELARQAASEPRFRYVRLERLPQPPLYNGRFSAARNDGFALLAEGQDVCIVACGYLTHKALRARETLRERGVRAAVVDLFRIKPMNASGLASILGKHSSVLTVEEQMLEGGFGSAVAEVLVDANMRLPMKRLGIRDGFKVVNGDRDYLHRLYNIDTPDIVAAAVELAKSA